MFVNPLEDINSQIDKVEFEFPEFEKMGFCLIAGKYLTYLNKVLHSRSFRLFVLLFIVAAVVFPSVGYCSVESTLSGIQSKLITSILPLVAILGLLFAALSFASGSQNARGHLVLAIVGAVVGFGAPSIIAFIRGLVQ